MVGGDSDDYTSGIRPPADPKGPPPLCIILRYPFLVKTCSLYCFRRARKIRPPPLEKVVDPPLVATLMISAAKGSPFIQRKKSSVTFSIYLFEIPFVYRTTPRADLAASRICSTVASQPIVNATRSPKRAFSVIKSSPPLLNKQTNLRFE